LIVWLGNTSWGCVWAAWVADRDTVIAETGHASGLDASGVAVAERPNPMIGPFFIEGAEPGDTLALRINRLTPSRATGYLEMAMPRQGDDQIAGTGIEPRSGSCVRSSSI
jgi:acetamidase/formamidase